MESSRYHTGQVQLRRSSIRTILVAPDSFKGSLTAREAAAAMSLGVLDEIPGVDVSTHPLSDGGEGLVDVLTPALGCTVVETEVQGPLPGQRVVARWGYSAAARLAILEMAQSSGLMLVPPERRDPKTTTTFGVGELLLAAIDRAAKEIILGIGGSATNDGGSGMAEALGVRFMDGSGTPLGRGGGALLNLDKIDVRGLDSRIFRTKITAACDVSNPLTGPRGASAVYGPQKGASKEDVALLDRALQNYGDVIRTSLGIDLREIPGSGAAGGLGAGLVAFCHGILKPGIDVVLEATKFEEKVMRADLILTGEGKLDSQTRFGKTLSGVMRYATAHGKPLIAVVGIVEGDEEEFLGPDGLYSLASLVDRSTSKMMAMENAERLVRKRTADLLRSILEE